MDKHSQKKNSLFENIISKDNYYRKFTSLIVYIFSVVIHVKKRQMSVNYYLSLSKLEFIKLFKCYYVSFNDNNTTT